MSDRAGGVSHWLLSGLALASGGASASVLASEPTPNFSRSNSPVRECDAPAPAWIFCDDFETDRLERYFEYDSAKGQFTRVASVGVNGSFGMRARWASKGTVSAGSLHLAFGRTPQKHIRPVDGGTTNHREIYWRFYLRNAPDWSGGGGHKLTRAQSLASPKWAQAMLAPVWSGGRRPSEDRLVLDPVSGTDPQGSLRATRYNDNPNFRWLRPSAGRTGLFSPGAVGRWYCVEAQVRLNDPSRSNGLFRVWVDGKLDAEREGLNWVGQFSEYGINTVFLENYWNGGAPKAQERYFDRFVVSTGPIGCR